MSIFVVGGALNQKSHYFVTVSSNHPCFTFVLGHFSAVMKDTFFRSGWKFSCLTYIRNVRRDFQILCAHSWKEQGQTCMDGSTQLHRCPLVIYTFLAPVSRQYSSWRL
mmetsp:Transcript_33253/g.43836  ORF Transcript_33253/g.43836 Transcript_33253/m.43836 type:complete len:108 (-) Transcript_33253:835-1158(-)